MARKTKKPAAKKKKALKRSKGLLSKLPSGWEKHTIAEIEEMGPKKKKKAMISQAPDEEESDDAPVSPKRAPKGRALRPSTKPETAEEDVETPEEKPEKEAPASKRKLLLRQKDPRASIKVTNGKDKSVASFLTSLNNIGMGKQAFLFSQSIAIMLNAGLPLLDSLRIFQTETKARSMKKIVGRIIADIESGTPFWHAMENQHLFSPYDIAMVRIGEESGNLAQNMEYLAEQKEKDRELKQKVKMAMIYPTIVLTMMFIIVMGLGLFVLPNLVQVLFSLDVDLPVTTRAVIYVTNIFSRHGKVFAPLLIVFMFLFGLLAKFTSFRTVAQWVTFHIPGVGRLAREATIARFGVILGGLLKAGVPFVDALESLAEVTHVSAYKKFYRKLLEHARVGDSFSKSFDEIKSSEKLLPVSVQQLVVAGERSGSLADSLLKVATIYEKKASETAQVLPIILEPMLLLFIGALVGVIAFAIIVPIYSVVGNIGSA